MSSRPSLLAAGAAAVALQFTACGGDDGDRPSAADLAETFEESGVDADAADCLGEAYADSDISDAGLRQILDADLSEGGAGLTDVEASDDDTEAAAEVADAVSECILDGTDVPTTDVPVTTEG